MRGVAEANWNVMTHAQKSDFVFRRNGRVHLNRRGRQFSRLLAAEVCASAVVMLNTSCSEVMWRVLAAHSIRQFPLHFPSCASPAPSHFYWSLIQTACGINGDFMFCTPWNFPFITPHCNLDLTSMSDQFQNFLKFQLVNWSVHGPMCYLPH
jgi:hypothetical protein